MNGETGEAEKVEDTDDDVVANEFSDDTVVLDDVMDDDVGDLSVELDVSQLVAKLDSTDDRDVHRKREIHRRLEALQDERESEKNIDSTYNFNLDDDL
jgi:hypothetical protein